MNRLETVEFGVVDCTMGETLSVRRWAGSSVAYTGQSGVAGAEILVDSLRLAGLIQQKKQRSWLASIGLETCYNDCLEGEMSNALSDHEIPK